MYMKKQLANILTGSRVVGSIALLFLSVYSIGFCAVYLFCGFSDMIDGTVARKTSSVSEFGSRLDTVADFIFTAVCLIKLLPLVHIPVWLWVWIAVIAVIKVANIAREYARRGRLLAVHSVLNRVTGGTLFLLPLTLQFIEPLYSLTAVCAIATAATVQESYIIIE